MIEKAHIIEHEGHIVLRLGQNANPKDMEQAGCQRIESEGEVFYLVPICRYGNIPPKILDIAREMVAQDNRATQHVLFIVKDQVETYVTKYSDHDIKRRKDIDTIDTGLLCDECRVLLEDEKELPPLCERCDEDCFDFIKVEVEPDLEGGVFLTAKACEKHIEENRHHYTKPFSYGISAYRNPEMQAVMQHLCLMTGDIPLHYQS